MITVHAEDLMRARDLLQHIPGGIQQAVMRAINRAADSSKTAASKKVREEYTVKARDIASTIRIRKASTANLSAYVISTGGVLPLSKFQVRPSNPDPRRKTPIVVRVKKGAGGPIKNAFVAKMDSGHVGVFHRVGKSRFPVEQNFGPSIPQMLGANSVSKHVEERAQEQIILRLEHEIGRLLAKGAK